MLFVTDDVCLEYCSLVLCIKAMIWKQLSLFHLQLVAFYEKEVQQYMNAVFRFIKHKQILTSECLSKHLK
jgi:hypothetical protein